LLFNYIIKTSPDMAVNVSPHIQFLNKYTFEALRSLDHEQRKEQAVLLRMQSLPILTPQSPTP